MATNKKVIRFNKKYKRLFKKNKCRYILITGGRGSGKSFVIAFYLAWKSMMCTAEHFYFFRYTLTKAFKSTILEFEEKIPLLNLSGLITRVDKTFFNEKTKTDITFAGMRTSSGNETAALKSLKDPSIVLIDEAEEISEDEFDNLAESVRVKGKKNEIILSMNPQSKDHWVYKRFFEDEGVDPHFNGIKGNTMYINTDYRDNLEHLDEAYLEDIERTKIKRPLRYAHKFLGNWLDNLEGALWTYVMIRDAKARYDKELELKYIVVAVDPSVASTGKQDECGIVVAGRYNDDEYVVIEDATGIYSPAEWGKKTIEMYEKYNANAIVVETNQGGDLCVDNIKNAASPRMRNKIKIEKVHASKGKVARAEPIATLYENDRVAHAGGLSELELEIVTYNPLTSKCSPGRLDALVWALTYLFKPIHSPRMVL